MTRHDRPSRFYKVKEPRQTGSGVLKANDETGLSLHVIYERDAQLGHGGADARPMRRRRRRRTEVAQLGK